MTTQQKVILVVELPFSPLASPSSPFPVCPSCQMVDMANVFPRLNTFLSGGVGGPSNLSPLSVYSIPVTRPSWNLLVLYPSVPSFLIKNKPVLTSYYNFNFFRVDALGEETNTDLGIEHRSKVSSHFIYCWTLPVVINFYSYPDILHTNWQIRIQDVKTIFFRIRIQGELWYGSGSSTKKSTRKIFKKWWKTLITHVLWVYTT